MIIRNHKYKLLVLAMVMSSCTVSWAQSNWYVKSSVGFSQISDDDGAITNIGAIDGFVDVDLDYGFSAGAAVGYRFNDRWAADLGWEYRSNDSEAIIADGTLFDDGNYAASIFSLNGYYHFEKVGKWQSYLGLGLIYGQEIDIDLERNGEELSFSNSGETGLQAMWGTYYALNEHWLINAEVKYSRFTNITLTGESTPGIIEGLDYKPLSFNAGLEYRF